MALDLYLASASPRRYELLQQLLANFRVLPADIVEVRAAHESAESYVQRLAGEKANAVRGILIKQNQWFEYTATLGSDTIVTVMSEHERQVLEKPNDYQHFQQMMRTLSGRSHEVMTAVHLCSAVGSWQALVTTEVTFAELTEAQIEGYWLTGEPQDKAGGYGIQGQAGKFVRKIDGSYSAVVGLPLYETDQLLQQWRQQLNEE
ncbi:MAG: Maf family nucleotide pyrophosphatase [Aliidiomarina sp.]|nr:Maf family nucleotide pyrophosphatase [Aliidiomarina sp.]